MSKSKIDKELVCNILRKLQMTKIALDDIWPTLVEHEYELFDEDGEESLDTLSRGKRELEEVMCLLHLSVVDEFVVVEKKNK